LKLGDTWLQFDDPEMLNVADPIGQVPTILNELRRIASLYWLLQIVIVDRHPSQQYGSVSGSLAPYRRGMFAIG
jgi:hypothetical protein